MDSFDLDSAVENIKSFGFKVIRPLTSRTCYTDLTPPEKLLKAAILDTETTGINPEIDKIIELGIVIFEYCPETGQVYRVFETYDELEDPGIPIPPEATKTNGIVDEMVCGKKIRDEDVETLLSDVVLIIAHNADFDRKISEKRFPFLKEKSWACSYAQIPWKDEGFKHASLEFLAYRFGFHFPAHRALDDCFALLEVLQSELPESGVKALKMLLTKARTCNIKLWATGADFDLKDKLKSRGYCYKPKEYIPERKIWHKMFSNEEFIMEIDWLRSEIYGNMPFALELEKIKSQDQFTTRRGEIKKSFY